MGTLGNAPPVLAASPGSIPAFAREIQDDWFDVAPSAERSRAVARAWRQFWQYNAFNALASAAEGLGQELHRLLGAVEAYDVDRSLAPRLSARLATLMEAMSKGDGYGVYDTVQAWCADSPATWYAEGCATESIAVHAWEAHLLHEVRVTRVEGAAPPHFFPRSGCGCRKRGRRSRGSSSISSTSAPTSTSTRCSRSIRSSPIPTTSTRRRSGQILGPSSRCSTARSSLPATDASIAGSWNGIPIWDSSRRFAASRSSVPAAWRS